MSHFGSMSNNMLAHWKKNCLIHFKFTGLKLLKYQKDNGLQLLLIY